MENVLLNQKNEQNKKNIRYVADAKKNKFWITQSCPTLCDPMDSNPPGSSVHGILQARILEWVAIPFSRGSSQATDRIQSPALQVYSLPSELPGKFKKNRAELKWHDK